MKFIDLEAQYRSIKKQIDAAIKKTVTGGHFILGENGKTLEKKIAELVGASAAVGLNSGTDALFLALTALGLKNGDEVITTPFSFFATAETIVIAGAKPVFVDIDPKTFNIDVGKIERAVTKKTKIILPVHLYGQMADMAAIRRIAKKYKLFVIEDAAQAIGAEQKYQVSNGKYQVYRAGSAGDIACFSFFPTKNLGAYGDAGMLTTSHPVIAEKIRLFRNHGAPKKYYHEHIGYSSRLDELQAAVLLAKLPNLAKWNQARQRLASLYTKALSGLAFITTPFVAEGNNHIFHQHTIRTPHRDALAEFLAKRNIPTSIHYPTPLHLQPALSSLGYKKGDFPEAELAAEEVLSLPLYPELKEKDQKKVIAAIHAFGKK